MLVFGNNASHFFERIASQVALPVRQDEVSGRLNVVNLGLERSAVVDIWMESLFTIERMAVFFGDFSVLSGLNLPIILSEQ